MPHRRKRRKSRLINGKKSTSRRRRATLLLGKQATFRQGSTSLKGSTPTATGGAFDSSFSSAFDIGV